MSSHIEYTLVPDLPKLGWLAKIDHSNKVFVYHGPKIECHPEWMVEGVWNGEFESGNFHDSIVFYGSGVRISNGKIYLSTSITNQTRLIYCKIKNEILVSNSLILMLAFTNAEIDEKHDYERECTSVLRGTKSYDRRFRVKHSSIDWFYQVFYENMVVSDGNISFESRFHFYNVTTYKDYIDKLENVLNGLKSNYQSPMRQYSVVPFTMLSSGYDSTAVTCLVKNIGVKNCYTSRQSNSILPGFMEQAKDDGTHVAIKLGMTVSYLDPVAKHIEEEDELFFLARGARAGIGTVLNESIMYPMTKHIESQCEVGVVFRGDHGDTIWETDVPDKCLVDDIIRSDECGTALFELRLKSGVIPIAVPYIFAENIKKIHSIILSDSMKPWRTFNSYDRPIARRIIESSGIERGMFAKRKKAMVSSYRYPDNRHLRKEFRTFLKRKYGVGRIFIFLYLTSNAIVSYLKHILSFTLGIHFYNARAVHFFKKFDMAFIMWNWAIEVLATKYRKVFQDATPRNN